MSSPRHTLDALESALDAYRRRDRMRRLAEAGAVLALALWLGIVGLSLIERLVEPSMVWRGALGGLAASLGLAGLGMALLHLSRGLDKAGLAWAIERHLGGELAARLATAVELQGSDGDHDPLMVEACAAQAAQVLEGRDVAAGVDFLQVRRGLLWLAGCVIAFGMVVGYNPWSHYHLLARFLAPALGIEMPVPVRFRVTPGSVRLLAGTRFRPHCQVEGEAPGQLIAVRKVDGMATERFSSKAFQPDGSIDFGPVHASFDYRFEMGAYRSPSYRVEVVEPPRPEDVVLLFDFPEHTQLQPRTQKNGELDIVAPKGTKVQLMVTTNRPLKRAWVEFTARGASAATTLPATLASEPNRFDVRLDIEHTGNWQIRLEDLDGFEDPAPRRHRLVAEEDALPKVYVLEPGRDQDHVPGPGPVLPVKLHAADGYGLEAVSIDWVLRTRRAFKDEQSGGRLEVPLPGRPTEVTTDVPLDFSHLELVPGDVLSYRARARDSRPGGPEDGAAYSHRYRIQVPFPRDEHARLAEEEKAHEAGLEALAEEQKDWEKRLDSALRDVSADGEITWKERRELEALLQEQKELRRKAQDQAAQMQQSLEEAKDAGILDPEVEEKMAEVQKMLRKLADDKMHQRMQELQELMSQVKVDPGKMKELRKRYDKEAHSKSLERMLEALKKLKTQQEIEKVRAEVEALRQDQEKLLAETERRQEAGEDVAPLAMEQAALERRTQQAADALEELGENLGEESEESRDGVENARQSLEEGDSAQKHMNEAQSKLGEKQAQDAEQSQRRAARKLRQAESALQQANADLQSKRRSVDLMQVVALVRLGLDVSRNQEGVVEDAFDDRRDPRQQCRKLASDQDTLYRGIHRFEGMFEDSLEDELELKEQFLTAISDLVDEFQEAKVNFEQVRPFTGRQLARTALVKLNTILAQLLDIQEEIQDSMGQSSMEEMMERLERMIKQQKMLNQQTEKLERSPEDAERQRQLAEELSKDQGQLRDELEQLRQQAEENRQTEGMSGKLGEIGKEMQAVEEALRQMQHSQETRQQQRRIVTRMLDMAQSIQKQGESNKREAEAAQRYEPPPAPPAPPDLAETRRRFFENQEREGSPLEDREAVERYLDLLAREGGEPLGEDLDPDAPPPVDLDESPNLDEDLGLLEP